MSRANSTPDELRWAGRMTSEQISLTAAGTPSGRQSGGRSSSQNSCVITRNFRGRPLKVARRLGIPIRDFLFRHLERHAEDGSAWFQLVHEADAETLARALELARRHYDLDDLAEGPALELYRGEGVFEVADWLLQELVDHPGKGWEVIRPALRSPVVRNRHFALRSLSNWPPELLTEQHREAVAKAAVDDPDEEVRDDARRVLRGETIEPREIHLDDEDE